MIWYICEKCKSWASWRLGCENKNCPTHKKKSKKKEKK